MFLVMFCPYNGSAYVPQVLCRSEWEAREAIINMPRNAFGEYSYTFVPVIAPLSNMVYIPNNY